MSLTAAKIAQHPFGFKISAKAKEEQLYQDFNIYNHSHNICIGEDKSWYICLLNANKNHSVKLERI